jgi:hypothetical protein
MKENNLNYEEILKKIEELKKGRNFDLSVEEDLAIAIMNLVSLEEHFFFTGEKTDKPEYFDLLLEVRAVRTRLLAKMIQKTEGESWCVSKHLLAASMRMFEVGVKYQADNKKNEAKEMFDEAYKMFTTFFALRLKIIDISNLKKIADEEKPMNMKDIMTKLVDCCKE